VNFVTSHQIVIPAERGLFIAICVGAELWLKSAALS